MHVGVATLAGDRRDRDLSRRMAWAALTAMLVVAAGLRFWGLQFGFPHTSARTDEEVIVDLGLALLRDPNPHFFDWPTLFMYVTSVVYRAFFAVERATGGAIRSADAANLFHRTTLHLIVRVLSALAGTASVALLYGAVRERFSRRVAVLSAAFLSVAYLHARDSHFGVTDVPATCVMLAAWWAGLRCATRGATVRHVVWAGALAGLAASTKYNTALVLLPATVALAAACAEGPASVGRTIRAVALLGVAFVLGFLVGTPYALLDAPAFYHGVTAVRSHLAGGHVVMARGWIYHPTFTLRYGVGLPLLLAALVGACWLAAESPYSAALMLSFPLAYFAVLGSGRTVFARYMLPMVPFICFAAAFTVDRLVERFDRHVRVRYANAAFAVGATLWLAVPTLTDTVAFDRLMTRADSRVVAADWVTAHFPDGASIYQTGFGDGHLQLRPREKYLAYAFDERDSRFRIDGAETLRQPDLVVILESPLSAYSTIPSAIPSIVAHAYDPAFVVEGIPAPSASVHYDFDDALFVPYAGIAEAVRPGPTARIFVRRAQPSVEAGSSSGESR